MKRLKLPTRIGPRPATDPAIPHSQLDQHGPAEIAEKLAQWAFSLSEVHEQPSRISVPGARALVLDDCVSAEHKACMVGREFAHIHPAPDLGSLHLKLPAEDAETTVKQGWGEHHPLVDMGHQPVGLVLVYAARDEEDLAVVKQIIEHSYQYASQRLAS